MGKSLNYEYIIKARRICMKLSENKIELYNDSKGIIKRRRMDNSMNSYGRKQGQCQE